MKTHSLISPSSSGRVMKCPASLLSSLFAPRTSNAMADRGTALHEVADMALERYFRTKVFETDLHDDIQAYYAECVSLMERAIWFSSELRVPLDLVSPIGGQFGTSDFVAIVDTTLYVNDLKTGKGIVSPFGNSQLSHYGAGALQIARDNGFIIDTIKLGISQGEVVEYETISLPDLLIRIEGYRAKYVEALSRTASYHMGDHCKYCPAKATCPEQKKAFDLYCEQIEHNLVGMVELTELVEIYRDKKDIIDYLESVEERLLLEALEGNPVKGTMLKPGVVRRAWSNPDEVLSYLQANRSDWVRFVKLGGLSEIIKAVPELESMAVKPEPKMVLALVK